MSAFVIAQLIIHDRAAYNKYGAAVDETLVPYGGRILSVEEHPNVLEGTWTHTRTVVLEFPSSDQAIDWYSSAQYQAIVGQRQAASSGNLVILRGQ
jgi:uncharacterized protein (DUF1330 family)